MDKITIVKPNEVESLAIEADADYVTLMTCTPYGINTHRLLVRGKRVENLREKKYITTEAFKIDNLIVTPLFSIPIIVMLLFMIVLKPVNKKIGIEKYIYPSKYKGGSK